MSSNHKKVYSYFCVQENKWIDEETDYNTVPTVCKNDNTHTIRDTYLKVGDYCIFSDNTNVPELFDLNSFDYNNMTANEKKLLNLIRALLMCAHLRNLIVLN